MTSPFKFLDSYSLADHGTFFGRDRESGELFRQCFTGPILVVYGGSGTGKTSLVQCGLASRFLESDWLPILVRRSGDMLTSLIEAVEANTLTASTSSGLNERVANLYLDHFKPIYFIFDQFEELFIFGKQQESEAFFTAIHTLLEAQRNVHAIFIVREEYLAELTRYEHIVPGLIENRYRVERMARSHAVEVVEKLCAANGIQCSDGFSAAMVDRLNPEGHGVELSYLQVYLDRCWRSRQNDEPFSIALLERIGYVDDLLGAFLDEQVADTPEPERAEALLKTFVSDQGTKRQLTTDEAHEWVNAIGTAMEPAEVDRLLQVFVTKRLLKDRDERGRYELLHDALARQIFQRITRAEQELIEVRQFVQQAFGQFQKRGVKLTAGDLAYLRPYRNQLHLKGEIGAFVEGAFGEEERKQKRRKRRRWLVTGVLTLAFVASGIFGYRTFQKLKLEEAKGLSNSLAEWSMNSVEENPFLAYLKAEKAYNAYPGLPASRALLRAYNSLYPEAARFDGTVSRVSENRRNFLIIDAGRGFTVHDLEGRTLFTKRLTSHRPEGVQFILSGTHVLCVDSVVSILDLQGRSVFTCDTASWLAYNNEGRFLGVTRDSLVYERNGGIEALRWPTDALVQSGRHSGKAKHSVSSVGFLDSTTVYLFGADSLRLVSLGAPPRKIIASVNSHPMFFSQAGVVHGKLVCNLSSDIRSSDIRMFDPASQLWSVVWAGNGFTRHHLFGDVVIVQSEWGFNGRPAMMEVFGTNGDFSEPLRLNGFFVQHFESNGTTLATPSAQETGEAILYGDKGETLFREVGNPAAFDKLGFVTITDSTAHSDRVEVWNAQGRLLSKLEVRKVSNIETPTKHAIWLDRVGDTTVVGYFSDAVFNGHQVKEFRTMQEDRVTSYMTLPHDLNFDDRTIFRALAEGRSLVRRGRYGHVLTKRQSSREVIPYEGQGYPIIPIGFVKRSSTKQGLINGDTASAYSAFFLTSWRPGAYLKDSAVIQGRRLWDEAILYELKRPTSPKGDLGWIHSVLLSPNNPQLTRKKVRIWDVRKGKVLDNRWLANAENVLWTDYDTAVALVMAVDSIYVMDNALTRGLLSEARVSSELASEPDEQYPAFWERNKNLVRIFNLRSIAVSAMRIEPGLIDPRIYAAVFNTEIFRISAQNDSIVYFTYNYLVGGGLLQCFVNGKSHGTIETPGSSRLYYRDGVAYLRSTHVTVMDGEGGIQQERGDQVTYYRLDDSPEGLLLTKVEMKTAEPPSMEFNVTDDRIRWWDDDLLKVDGSLLDVHLPQRVLATHRLLNEYEEFPMSPKAAIDLVRNKKVYGEFWKEYEMYDQVYDAIRTVMGL